MNLSLACIDTLRPATYLNCVQAVDRISAPLGRSLVVGAVACALSTASAANASTLQGAEEYQPHVNTTRTTTADSNGSTGDLFVIEGDIIVAPANTDGGKAASLRGFGHDRLLERWPNGVIPYSFDAGITDEQRESVALAIAHYHDKTRILFVEAGADDGHSTRLIFRPIGGCASYVGRTDLEEQDIFIENCSTGSIIHELAHVIGLYHEHTRRDRDNFITVKFDDVIERNRGNFEILTANTAHYGDYDYGSIMHYGEYFFSRNGNKTIEAPDGINIGQRDGLSGLDIATINRMYATDLDLSVGAVNRTLQTDDGTAFDGMVIDVAVTNLGSLGASLLNIEVELASDAQWLTISQNSGWDCSISAAILSCDSSVLGAGETTTFELTANPGSATIDDLAANLTSRTQDLDSTNNLYNDGVEEQASQSDSGQNNTAANGGNNTTQDSADEPEGNKESITSEQANTADSSSPALGAALGSNGGGGVAGGWLLVMAGLVAGLRRRNAGRPALVLN